MRKGIIIVFGMILIGFLVYNATVRPTKDTGEALVIKPETVLNEVAIGDSVERVVKYFGSNYDQEERMAQFGSAEAANYLVYLYPDARIYSQNRLVKAIELITPTFASPRGPKVGSTRDDIEHYYWRPNGFSGTEAEYEFTFNTHLVFYFDDLDSVSRIVLY